MQAMSKDRAIALLGGSMSEAARRIGVTVSAISQWPEVLPARLEDRVLAALARVHLPHLVQEQEAGPAPADRQPA
jgi:transcriptional regulator with XRE-family HTH domain